MNDSLPTSADSSHDSVAYSARLCLEEITKLLPDAPNIEQHFSAADFGSKESVLRVLEAMKVGPEWRTEHAVDELSTHFGSPVLLRLSNGHWVCYLGYRKATETSDEHFATFDPLSQDAQKILALSRAQLEKAFGGESIMLRRFSNANFSTDGRHTKLYCFTMVCRHLGVDAYVRRFVHDYAIGDEEPSSNLLGKMAEDNKLKLKSGRVKWAQMYKIESTFPCIAIDKQDKAVVIVGRKPMEEGSAVYQLGIWDPVSTDGMAPTLQWIGQEAFEARFTGEVLLMKKNFSLLDENQPFGLAWFIPEFLRQKKLLGQVALAVLIISGIGLAIPLFFQIVVDKVLVHHSHSTLNVLGIAVVTLLVFNAIFEYLQNYFLIYSTNRIDIRLAMRTFAKLLSLPVDFYERISSGVLIKHMQQSEKIRNFLSGSLFFSLLELISLTVFLPILFLYSTKLTLLVLLFTLLMALVIAVLIKPFQRRLEELYLAEGKRQSMLVETINGVRTVKSLALEPVQQRKWNDVAAYAISRYFRVAKISMTARTISGFLERLMSVSIIWVGALLVFDDMLSVGALIAFQMLAGRVTGPLVKIVGLIHEYQQTALSVKMLGVVMNSPEEQVGGGIRQPLRGEISFENIRFQYLPDAPPAINNFNYRIMQGSTVGLVGRSGSGKTTLTKLMQGLYPIQQGIIKFDGIDIREIDRSHLRSHIGIVLQDNYFFNGSIRENLSITRKDATMEEIIHVAKLAGAEEFIQNMPMGYESILEENASNLSGGQRQRLAIARALLPNPRILIFDEATSALDPESETLIRRNLKQIARNRTVFIISHRLSILCRADDIIVMEKGSIAETGNHEKLLSQKGIYAKFWQQQMTTIDD